MQAFVSLAGEPGLKAVTMEDAVAQACGAADGAVTWIHLTEPSSEELTPVAEALSLPPLAVEDALHAHQRAKRERYEDVVFFVLRTLRYTEATSAIDTGELMLFSHPHWIVTVQHGPSDAPHTARRRLTEEPELLRHGAYGVLYALADAVVDTYGTVVGQVAEDIEELELTVFTPERVDLTRQIYSLKREVLEFRGAVRPLVPVAQELMSPGPYPYPDALAPYFRDVADHVLRVAAEVAGCDELTDSMLNAHSTQAGIWQNEDMRKISAWAAIIAAPTMIAGVYGMNFDHMPELHWSFGYPGALGLMALMSGLLYRAFRRNGWL
ncbi:magnesium and cobalt transport protein CorA [Streptomyces sp. TRM 70351]|uniref:magnesium and cobalt transport protein CorA n=1 Tax=Streptomyces sp. TRM 70351 TaxID=3116552 RepID=UPI002E7AC77D|nr:magnesium and cobalt transport protein CorA [Streptomyces sp. TRM 70351]MEE1929963.1 magnesium and cobalt transport protein CorA [Streptomyces sp. TRM 70351]